MAAVATCAALALTGCVHDDDGDGPEDGGPVTADTGPTTPDETTAETGTPEAPTATDAQPTGETTDAGISDAPDTGTGG